jgi:hypothetical protein
MTNQVKTGISHLLSGEVTKLTEEDEVLNRNAKRFWKTVAQSIANNAEGLSDVNDDARKDGANQVKELDSNFFLNPKF